MLKILNLNYLIYRILMSVGFFKVFILFMHLKIHLKKNKQKNKKNHVKIKSGILLTILI